MFKIETTGAFVFVTTSYRHPRLDEAASRLQGRWWAKDKHYTFPTAAEDEIRAIVAEIDVPQTTVDLPEPVPAAEPQQPQRSARSKPLRSHPLGTAIRKIPGGTVYRDDFTGSEVRIYDEW